MTTIANLELKAKKTPSNLIKKRKEIFIKKVSELLSGILYEKSRVVYDIHSNNFTMFIYFGKRNTNCLDAFFNGKSNYFFGSMNEKEIKIIENN